MKTVSWGEEREEKEQEQKRAGQEEARQVNTEKRNRKWIERGGRGGCLGEGGMGKRERGRQVWKREDGEESTSPGLGSWCRSGRLYSRCSAGKWIPAEGQLLGQGRTASGVQSAGQLQLPLTSHFSRPQ